VDVRELRDVRGPATLASGTLDLPEGPAMGTGGFDEFQDVFTGEGLADDVTRFIGCVFMARSLPVVEPPRGRGVVPG